MTDYKQIIKDVPELALHLAHAITPTAQPNNGTPGGNSRQDAARGEALDDLNQLVTELVESVRFWERAFDETGLNVPSLDIRMPACSDEPEAAAKAVQPLVAWLLTNWDDADGHPFFEWWCEALDEWLAPMVKRLQRQEKRQHPRRCTLCGTLSVWADLEHMSGLCDQCGQVHRAEIWLPAKEIAKILDVNRSTITRWIQAGAVDTRKRKMVTLVELRQCREHMELADARKRLNLVK